MAANFQSLPFSRTFLRIIEQSVFFLNKWDYFTILTIQHRFYKPSGQSHNIYFTTGCTISTYSTIYLIVYGKLFWHEHKSTCVDLQNLFIDIFISYIFHCSPTSLKLAINRGSVRVHSGLLLLQKLEQRKSCFRCQQLNQNKKTITTWMSNKNMLWTLYDNTVIFVHPRWKNSRLADRSVPTYLTMEL